MDVSQMLSRLVLNWSPSEPSCARPPMSTFPLTFWPPQVLGPLSSTYSIFRLFQPKIPNFPHIPPTTSFRRPKNHIGLFGKGILVVFFPMLYQKQVAVGKVYSGLQIEDTTHHDRGLCTSLHSCHIASAVGKQRETVLSEAFSFSSCSFWAVN